MKKISVVFSLILLLNACGNNQNTTIVSGDSATAGSIAGTASGSPTNKEIRDAWSYLYGRYLVIQQENHDINEEKVGYNKIKYNPLGSAQFVNPNLDVAYLEAWIAVDSNHAVILNIPKVEGRYYTGQLLDGWGEVIANINERNYPGHAYGKFALLIKGTNPTVPADAEKIELPSGKIKLLARFELKGTPGVAQKLQKQVTLTVPEGIRIDPPLIIPAFTPAKPIGGEIFENANQVMTSYPDPMPGASNYQETVRKVVQYYNLNDSAKSRVNEVIVSEAIPAFFKLAKGFGTQKGGWSVSYVIGKFDNLDARDIVNYGGLWGNQISEAIYFIGQTDSANEMLTGNNTYEIRFPKDALPYAMVQAFWSLSLYSVPDYRVVMNPLNRYNLNNISPLKKNSDGSLTIWLSSAQPKDVPISNWLPTPSGKGFSLNLRMYVPKPQVMNGNWFPPPILKK